MTERETNTLCWIHIKDVYSFLSLGANPHERKVGQNIKLDLSVQIPFVGTADKLSNTMDYGQVIHRVQEFISSQGEINLLEFLADEILNLIGQEFKQIVAAKLVLHKAFVPLPRFTGSVSIEAERRFH